MWWLLTQPCQSRPVSLSAVMRAQDLWAWRRGLPLPGVIREGSLEVACRARPLTMSKKQPFIFSLI